MDTNPLEGLTAEEILEILPEGAVILDRGGLIVAVNSRTEEIFGRVADRLIGKPIQVLLPNRRGSFKPPFDEKRIRAMRESRDEVGQRKNGSEIPVDVRMSPIEVEEDLFVLATIRDISQIKNISTNLRDTERRWETVNLGG